jgi:hypothetical protein
MIAPTIKAEIIGRIRRGEYAPGQRLPTRMALTVEFNAARGTIDKVMAELQAEGLLRSSRGDGTYVLADVCQGQRHVFMVIPDAYILDLSPAGPWPTFLTRHCGGTPYTICQRRDLLRQRDRIAGCAARVIWVCPPGSSLTDIEDLHRQGIGQVLINRPHAQVGHVATDTMAGLRAMLAWLETRRGRKAGIGLLLPRFDLERPYRIEREAFFHEAAHEMGFRIVRMARAADDREASLTEAVRRFFQPPVPPVLFLPDIVFTPYVAMMARERGLVLGRDLIVLGTDAKSAMPGGACMGVPWRQLYEEAVAWALSEEPEPPRRLVAPEVWTDIDTEAMAIDTERKAMWDYIGKMIND